MSGDRLELVPFLCILLALIVLALLVIRADLATNHDLDQGEHRDSEPIADCECDRCRR